MPARKAAARRPRRRAPVRRRRAAPLKKVTEGVVDAKLVSFTPLATDSLGRMVGYVSLNNPSAGTDWANWVALYDQYRVKAVTIKYIPFFNEATADFAHPTYDVPVWIIQDNDSTGASLSGLAIADYLGYQGVRTKRLLAGWTQTFKVKKMQVSSGLPIGYQDTTATPSAVGCASYISPSTPYVSSSHGIMQYTYYVKFVGKR